MPSTQKRILNAKINFEEDVTELFSEFEELSSRSVLELPFNIKALMRNEAMHPIKAWLTVQFQSFDELINHIGVNDEGGYSVLRAKRPSAKRIEQVSLFLGITQASLRQSYSYYNDILEKREVIFSKLVLERLLELPAQELKILPNTFIDSLRSGIRPIEAMRISLSLTNEQFALLMNMSTESILGIKKTIIPHEKTLNNLARVSGVELKILRKIFRICLESNNEVMKETFRQ